MLLSRILTTILLTILSISHPVWSSDVCSAVPSLIGRAISTSEQLKITNSLLSGTLSTAGPIGIYFKKTLRPQPKPTLNSTFSLLAKRAGLKESPITFSTFSRAVQEISIAKAEACSSISSARNLNKTQLIQEFQVTYRKLDKDLHLLRSLVGRLLCVDSLVPQTAPSSLSFRAKRDTCPPRDECRCPTGGILGSLLCACEFFACLDKDNILSDLIFGFNVGDECIIFAIDTTGSMANEIALAKRIILEFVKIEEDIGEYGCYILVPFNDVGPNNRIVAKESVGPIVIAETAWSDELQDFYKTVNALQARGGHDTPEYALFAMLEGLRAKKDGFEFVVPGSQMVVITDANSKQPALKNEVIEEANARGVCIHFFLSGSTATSDGIYEDIASKTSGTLIEQFSDWQLAEFAQSYRENPCHHIQGRRKKRRATAVRSLCQYFKVTEFSILLKSTINAPTGRIVTITRPNRTNKRIVVGQGNLALLTEKNPVPGQWKACINTGTLQLFKTNTLLLDTTVVYLNDWNVASSVPPPACTSGKIVIVTSKARKISNASLNFVDKLGRVRKSVALQVCNGILVSRSITFPQGSFIYHLVGTDSFGIVFTYNTKTNATFTPSYNLTSTAPSTVTVGKGRIANVMFVLSGNPGCSSYFTFSSPSMSGFSTRISPSSATISNGQSLNVTMSVTVSNSRISSGTSRNLTLVASSGNIVVTAPTRITVQDIEEPTTSSITCGCQNKGRCIFYRGRPRCRCPSGFRGLKCERNLQPI